MGAVSRLLGPLSSSAEKTADGRWLSSAGGSPRGGESESPMGGSSSVSSPRRASASRSASRRQKR
jgi:hypothetical protein